MIISVIIPTYNRAAIISRTLNSLLKQSFQEWECIVVDDSSTDNTEIVLSEFCKKDARFKYIHNTRKKGAQGARNTGLYASNTEWVMFFDSDNSMHPELLGALFENAGDADVCKCFSNIINEERDQFIGVQDWIADGDIHQALFDGKTYVDYNQEIIRRIKLLQIGGLDEDCPSLQEFDTNIRLSSVAKYKTVQLSLVDYYIGSDDTISGNFDKQVRGKLYNLMKYRQDWLRNKSNAARFIYEIVEKIKKLDTFAKKVKYATQLVFIVPQMIPFYLKKHLFATKYE